MMGSRATLKAMNGEYATTPCLNQMLLDNKTVDYNKHPAVLSTLDVFFSDKWTSLDSLGGTIDAKRFVTVGPEAERDLLPQLEWLEFFSLFFDKEAWVQSYVQDTEAAMLCLTSKLGAARFGCCGPRPTKRETGLSAHAQATTARRSNLQAARF